MKIEYRIYGVRKREETIRLNQKILGIPDSAIIFDDRPNGGDVMYTARKAWLKPAKEDTTHLCVMQDDIELCDNFCAILDRIVTTHPSDVISLFPYNYQTQTYQLDHLPTPYIHTLSVSGCAVVMPVKQVKECFEFIRNEYNWNIQDDIGIDRWLSHKRRQAITTIPAIIQHIGDESLLCPQALVRKTVYYRKNPEADWECPAVTKAHSTEIWGRVYGGAKNE